MVRMSMLSRVRFSYSPPGGDRVYHVDADDVRTVLARLPDDMLCGLRGVHFNDRSFGRRILGYANIASGDIALCALPPRVSFTRAMRMGQTPELFGAVRGRQWPSLAI